MPPPLRISLSAAERHALERMRDKHKLAYLRERAGAILKVADGSSVRQVALHGLLKPRDPDTVYGWVHRYLAEGLQGLRIRAGRGRKPAFSPSALDETPSPGDPPARGTAVPPPLGHNTTRWTLADLLEEFSWLRLHTLGGLWQLLDRLQIHYKRARSYLHSPDPFYADKMDLVLLCQQGTQTDPERYVFLYLDEFTTYRQPTVACAYEAVGHVQPLARRSYRSSSWYRIVGVLNGLTGQVHWQQHAKVGVRQLIQFYRSLRQAYPQAEEIYVVQDNWPVHFHPQVMAHLQPQEFAWPLPLSPSWRAMPPVAPAQDRLPIRVLCLPTYAS